MSKIIIRYYFDLNSIKDDKFYLVEDKNRVDIDLFELCDSFIFGEIMIVNLEDKSNFFLSEAKILGFLYQLNLIIQDFVSDKIDKYELFDTEQLYQLRLYKKDNQFIIDDLQNKIAFDIKSFQSVLLSTIKKAFEDVEYLLPELLSIDEYISLKSKISGIDTSSGRNI